MEIKASKFAGISIASGLFFGILDGLINAKLLAGRLFEAYSPIIKTSINKEQ